MSDNTDKRTATQRIEDLEKVVTMLYQATAQSKNALENLLRSQGDMALVKDALKLLNKKTEAIIQCATPETGITVQAVSALVVKMNVEDLTAQVAGFVASGHLTAADEVAADSYLVCEELAADGTQVNPRIQFRLDSQDASTQEAFKGKKVAIRFLLVKISFQPSSWNFIHLLNLRLLRPLPLLKLLLLKLLQLLLLRLPLPRRLLLRKQHQLVLRMPISKIHQLKLQ